jgi:hypothetical protein
MSLPVLAWGAKVSPFFRATVRSIAFSLGLPSDEGANFLMACMAFESAETFRADIRNAAGSGAVGLIQFMPSTALTLGTTADALAAMRPDDQLHYVWKYFFPHRYVLASLSDVYMAILWPAAIGKSQDYVLWTRDRQPTPYRQNVLLDYDRNNAITKGEAARLVAAKLEKGLSPALAA